MHSEARPHLNSTGAPFIHKIPVQLLIFMERSKFYGAVCKSGIDWYKRNLLAGRKFQPVRSIIQNLLADVMMAVRKYVNGRSFNKDRALFFITVCNYTENMSVLAVAVKYCLWTGIIRIWKLFDECTVRNNFLVVIVGEPHLKCTY